MRVWQWVGGLGLASSLGLGCSDDAGADRAPDASRSDAAADAAWVADPERPARELSGDCDPLVPQKCLLPFPSDVYRVPDESRLGGHRIELPVSHMHAAMDPDAWRMSDGWSAGAWALAYLPGATTTGLPSYRDPAPSLEDDSPTVVLEYDTLRRVPHYAELDMSLATATERSLMVRPVERLKDATRYIVALRGVVDAAGEAIAPSPAFQALRDGDDFDDPSIEGGRALYEQIFGALQAAGVVRDSLQLAWDFTTATGDNNTRAMLHIRDDALSQVGEAGPVYRIDTVSDDVDAHIARRIEGVMTVPLYLDDPGPGGAQQYDADGLPMQQGTAEYPFLILIPRSATTTPAPSLIIGHGLLGSREQAAGFSEFANQFNYVLIAVDWVGMASDDVGHIAGLTQRGEMHVFKTVSDRLQQGFVNFMLAVRMMAGDMASDSMTTFAGSPSIDRTRRFYYGGSQGGIFGASVMALFTDITRGVLAVPGQPYGVLLNRSIDFDPYFAVAKVAFPDPTNLQLALELVQMLWDRAEPTGYSHRIRDPLPGTPAHEVLMLVALGDQEVSNIGGHIMARAVGAPLVGDAVREVFGVEHVDSPHQGSGLIEFDFGNPPDPIENVPPREGENPHGRIEEISAAHAMVHRFLSEGVIENLCDGPCDPD